MAGSDAELKATMVPRINTGNRMSAVAAAVGAEGWVACDLCDKWRRIKEDEVAQYENKAFHCRRVPRLHDILLPLLRFMGLICVAAFGLAGPRTDALTTAAICLASTATRQRKHLPKCPSSAQGVPHAH